MAVMRGLLMLKIITIFNLWYRDKTGQNGTNDPTCPVRDKTGQGYIYPSRYVPLTGKFKKTLKIKNRDKT